MARRATERGGATHGGSRKGRFLELCAGTPHTRCARLTGRPTPPRSAGSWKMQVPVAVDKVGHPRRAHLDRSPPPIQILYPPYRLHLLRNAVRHGPRTVRDDAKLVEGGTEPRFVGTVQVQSLA